MFDGRIELKRAICGKFKRENGLDYETVADHRQQRRQAGALQRDGRDPEPGDEVVIPAPYWVSYPEMVLLCDGDAGAGRVPAEQRLQDAAGGSRRGDHAEDQMADPQLAVEPVGRRLYRGRSARIRRGAAEASRMSGS